MTELLTKLTTYNLFNYLLPGVLFAAAATHVTDYNFIHEDIVIGVFIYYFLGLVVSRVGSLTVEPSLKKTGFIKFADYSDYLSAVKNDKKIEELSEVNNMYRTFISTIMLVLALKVYEVLSIYIDVPLEGQVLTLMVLVACLFLFSYRKQTSYITKRISKNK
jgi:hypothetical protein